MVTGSSLAVLSTVAYSSLLPLSLYLAVLICPSHPYDYTSLLGLSLELRPISPHHPLFSVIRRSFLAKPIHPIGMKMIVLSFLILQAYSLLSSVLRLEVVFSVAVLLTVAFSSLLPLSLYLVVTLPSSLKDKKYLDIFIQLLIYSYLSIFIYVYEERMNPSS